MPVLVPLLVGASASAVAITAGASVATAAVVGVGAAVVSKKTGVADKIYDEIVKPVGTLVKNVVKSDLGNAVLKVAAVATGNTWAVPLIDGAKVAANGGNVGDVLKAAAISYVSQSVGDVTGKYVTSALADTGASQFVIDAVTSGAKSATKAMVYGQDPLKAFAQGGLTAAVSAGLGKVDETLRENYGETFENLDDKVKESVFSGLTTELSGGDLTEGQVGDIIAKYTGAANVVNDFLKDNVGLSAEAAGVLTRAVSDSVSTALAGGSGLDAFSGSLSAAGAAALKKVIDKPVYKAIDRVTGAYKRTESAADALTSQSEKAATAANALNAKIGESNSAVTSYNRLQAELAGKIQTQDSLKSTYDAALAKYNSNKTQANADATTAALDAYNKYATNLKTDYENNYKDQMAGYKTAAENANAKAAALRATFEAENAKVTELQAVYDDELKWVVTETDNLDATLKPKMVEVNKAVALTLRPQIDEDKYREATGLGEDEDVWGHYLANQKEINTIFAQQAVDDFNRAKNDITSDTAPTISSEITRPNTYGPPSMPGMPEVGNLPDVDLTVPKRPSGRGDPRDYGLTKEEIDAYTESSVGKDAWYNFVSGAYEAAAYTAGGFGTFADEIAENVVNTFVVDTSEAYELAYSNYAIYYDPTLSDEEKAERMAINGAASMAAREKAFAEEGVNIDTFSGYTDPVKNYIMDASERVAGKISPEMQVRQYNALPAEDTTWEQILTGKAKDRLGRPYGLGDPLATVMSGVQELPDLLVDVALLAVTKNPAVLGGTVAATSMAEAGEAAADEIESNLRSAYNSGALQATPEFADLVRLYKGDEDAALERLIDQGMGYAAVSGVIGGLGDVVLGKIAGASGGSKLLSEVPTGLRTVVKVGTGGIAEGINEASEQVPVNMASINAGLDVDVSTGTGVAFLQGTTSGGTATAGAASFEAVANTLRMAKDGLLSYTMPDGSTVSPEPPSGADAEALETTSKNLAEYGVRVNLLNDLASWDVIPSQPSALTAQELTDTLNNLNIGDTAEVTNLVNTVYDNSVITLDEARTAFKQTPLTEVPSDSELDRYTGIREAAEFAAEVAAYVDPRFLDVDEVKAAAAAEGVILTDEQAEEYVGEKDEADAVADIAEEYDPQGTTRDEAEQFFADVGYTPTEAEITARMGATPETEQKENIAEYVDPRQVTEAEARKFYEDLGYNPTDAEIAQFVGQGGGDFEDTAPDRVETYVDPRQVTDEEAREFFSDLGYTPTDEQVAEFVAQVEETTQQDVISKYVDPRQVTQAEVQAIADEEGLTLTETLAATYLGQSEADTFQTEQLAAARAEYDPLATTLDEATQFFADTGYTATPEEIAEFVASKTEEAQTSAIGAYVDPRQVTAEEAQEFLSAIGYQPTQEEINQFTGQVNDANFEVSQQAAVDEYVDPRFFDAGEVRAAYEELGLVDVTQEDVDRFVGQFDPDTAEYGVDGFESAQLDELRTYMPTATFNVIKQIMGSPAVMDDPNTEADESKDATGIYAEFEAGATRDEALQTAIDELSTELGVTKDEVLTQIGLTEETLGAEIDAVQEDVTLVKEEVTGLGEQITDVETSLGADIQVVADLIGKPARDVTQTDVDFVVDLIAQENVAAETIQQYDVTGDGILDINDQNMLTDALQGTDVTLADTSIFTPATGLYLQQEQDTQTTMDAITNMNTQINTNIQTEAKNAAQRDFLQAAGMGAFDGRGVSVSTPDPMNINYLYDISGDSIFATPQQAGLFASPYGGTRAPTQTAQPVQPTQPFAATPRKFAQGGQIEDETDMLLRILGGS